MLAPVGLMAISQTIHHLLEPVRADMGRPRARVCVGRPPMPWRRETSSATASQRLARTKRGETRLRASRVWSRLPKRCPVIQNGTMAFDPTGPAFVSYRQSDGAADAVAIAWALRAAGVPVWHDATDLPPGETTTRLAEALAGGLSGAVLVVTPEVAKSRVVKTIELPRLLELSREPAFTFSIASTVFTPGSETLDHDAPDQLLDASPGTLKSINHYPVRTDTERADLAHWHARRRLEALRARIVGHDGELLLDVQTRIPPFAAQLDGDLVLRLRPPATGDRRPSRAGLGDLAAFAAGLPQLLAIGGARTVRVRGGAHLSVAFALGAAMPTTLLGRVDVVDTNGDDWTGRSGALSGAGGHLRVVEDRALAGGPGRPVLVYVDLLPQPSDPAYVGLRDDPEAAFSGVLHLRAASGDFLDPADAHDIVAELDAAIRGLAARHVASEVHLLLRGPYGAALLLGRRLNTLKVRVYEWEDGPGDDGADAVPRYLPALQVRSGAGGSPVEKVLLPEAKDALGVGGAQSRSGDDAQPHPADASVVDKPRREDRSSPAVLRRCGNDDGDEPPKP